MAKPTLSVSLWGSSDAGKTSLVEALRFYHKAELTSPSLESETRLYVCHDPGATKDPDEKIFTGNDPVIRMLWELLSPTDAAILVIDANTGTTPQTKAQLGLARLLGFPCPVIFLNKVEESLAGWLDEVEQEAREALIEKGFPGDDAPCIRGDTLSPKEEWCQALLHALDTFFVEPMPLEEKPLRAFCLGIPREAKSTGFIVKIQQGSIRVGDQIEVVGREPPYLSEVARIEAEHKTFSSPKEAATSGMTVACMLRARRSEEFPVGKILATPGTLKTYVQVKVRVYALPVWYHGISRQLSSMDSVQVAFGGSPMPALLSFAGGSLRVGCYDEAILTLPKAVLHHRYQTWSLTKEERDSCGPPVEIGSRFWLLREYRQWGFGVVTELLQEG